MAVETRRGSGDKARRVRTWRENAARECGPCGWLGQCGGLGPHRYTAKNVHVERDDKLHPWTLHLDGHLLSRFAAPQPAAVHLPYVVCVCVCVCDVVRAHNCVHGACVYVRVLCECMTTAV